MITAGGANESAQGMRIESGASHCIRSSVTFTLGSDFIFAGCKWEGRSYPLISRSPTIRRPPKADPIVSLPEDIMARSILLCSFLLCVSALCSAGEVRKCATPTGIAYQDVPCAGVELPAGATLAAQAPVSMRVNAPPSAGTRTPPGCDAIAQREPTHTPWRHAAICIGMTDDEVLNLPGWGRPASINRTRAAREWREEWFYDATRAAGARQLFFVNGKLDAVESNVYEPIGPLARN